MVIINYTTIKHTDFIHNILPYKLTLFINQLASDFFFKFLLMKIVEAHVGC